jgi:hypothetical protein
MSQAIAIPVASLRPANQASNATAYTVGPVDMLKFRRVQAHAIAGVIAATGNAAIYFQACTISNGTFANITGGVTVTLDTSNTEATIEMRSDQLGTNNRFLQLAVLVSGNTGFYSASVYGGEAHYHPASLYDFDTANTNLKRAVV